MKRLMTTNKPVMKIQNLIMNHESRYVKLNHALVSKHLNPMVHRMTFHTIKQDNTESIQDFLIHIQAAFSCPGCQYDLSNIYIRDQFVRGLQNSMLQTYILTKASQLRTLADIGKDAQSIEAAIQDQSHLENKHPV